MLKAMEMALKASWIEPDVLEGGKSMSEIRVKENESLESALRRFKRSCAKEGVIAEVKKREHSVIFRAVRMPAAARFRLPG